MDEVWLSIVKEYQDIEVTLRRILLTDANYGDEQIVREIKDYLLYRMAKVIFYEETFKMYLPKEFSNFRDRFPEECSRILKFEAKLISMYLSKKVAV